MELLINISQIAIITGDNQYKTKSDFLIEFWQKYDKKDYENCSKSIGFIKENDKEIIEKIATKNNINISQELKSCTKTTNLNDFSNIKKEILSKVNDLNETEKKEIIKSIDNVTNTKFGIKNENDVTKLYETMTNTIITKDNRYHKKNIYHYDFLSISIGGKIDGINNMNHCIIEVKNRINKLFYTLRDYEKVQIMCYMHLFESSKGHLVEALKKKNETEINIIEVTYDEKYMEHILSKIIVFGNFFYDFYYDKKLKKDFLENKIDLNIFF
jgi:hypothetical protein